MAKEIGYNSISSGNSGVSDRLWTAGSSSDKDPFYEVGNVLKEGITRFTLIADAREHEMLQRLDSDYKAIAKSIQSAINDTSYFREGAKSIDPLTGIAYKDFYIQSSEFQNAYSAYKTKLGSLVGSVYDTRVRQMEYITGTRNFEGKQAQAKAQYEIGRRGGKLLATPSADNPDQYTYMLPFSDTWAKGVALDDYLNFIFTDSDALSKLEHDKRVSDADKDRNYAKAKKMEMMSKLSLTQAKEAGGIWEEFENEQKKEEYKKLQENTARAKQMAMMDALTASQAKEAGGIWEEFESEQEANRKRDIEANYQANQRVKRENAQKDAEKAREAEKTRREEEREKAKETLASTTKRMFILGQIASMFTVLLDLTRRILSNGLSMASDAKRTEREARNIGSSYGAMLQYNYADKAYGLPEGTTPGALFALQRMFGNTANIDTKALGKLAMIMGNDVGDMVRSGLGGKNPEKLLEMIMDAFIKAQQSGVNQFGQQVGKEEARRSLYTLLSEISPEIATLFSRAVETFDYGINKGRGSTWKDYLDINKRAQGAISDTDLKSFSALGEVVDQLKAKFANFTALISQTFLLNFSRLIDRINNWNWGKNSIEQLEGRQANIDAIVERRSQLLSANANTAKLLEAELAGYGATGSLEQILEDVTENPDFYGTAGYSSEQIKIKGSNKQAMEELYASNPLFKSVIASYIVRRKMISEMEKELQADNPKYLAHTWSDESISAEARTVPSMALLPLWADSFFRGVDLTGGWSQALITEGYRLFGDEVFNRKYRSNEQAFSDLFNIANPTEKQRFENAFDKYYRDLYKTDKKGNKIETKELKLYRKALIDELTSGMNDMAKEDWIEKHKELLGNVEDNLSKLKTEGQEDEELIKRVAFIRLLRDKAENTGKGKKSQALAYYSEASSALTNNDSIWETDVPTIGSYFDKFIQEQGGNALDLVRNTGWTVTDQGGGVFTIRFEANVNGNKILKEYKNVPLSGNYNEPVQYNPDEVGQIYNNNARESSN